MRDFEDIGAEFPEPARHLPEQARPVVRSDAERGDAIVPFELAHHDGGEEPRIDIAAAQDEADPLSCEPLRIREHGAGFTIEASCGVLQGTAIREMWQRFQDAEFRTDWEAARNLHGDAISASQLPRTAAQPVAAMEALDRLPEVEKTSLFGTSVHAVLRVADAPEPFVARALAAAGLEARSISRVMPSLEDVFLDVVERTGAA